MVHQAERPGRGLHYDIAVVWIGGGVGARHVSGLVRLTVRDGVLATALGDRVCWQGRLRRPVRFELPAEFDNPRHLAARSRFVTSDP